MTLYAIRSTAGDRLGTFDADDPDDAALQYIMDAGYSSLAEAAAVLGLTADAFRADLVIEEEAKKP